jgi:hypothetical protein
VVEDEAGAVAAGATAKPLAWLRNDIIAQLNS